MISVSSLWKENATEWKRQESSTFSTVFAASCLKIPLPLLVHSVSKLKRYQWEMPEIFIGIFSIIIMTSKATNFKRSARAKWVSGWWRIAVRGRKWHFLTKSELQRNTSLITTHNLQLFQHIYLYHHLHHPPRPPSAWHPPPPPAPPSPQSPQLV